MVLFDVIIRIGWSAACEGVYFTSSVLIIMRKYRIVNIYMRKYRIGDDMRIFDRILEQCQEHKITGKELGELLGLKKSPMTDWKNGKAKPTIEHIIKMCEIFAVSSDYLIFGENIKLAPEEKRLLDAYRNADPGIQQATRKLLDLPEPADQKSESKLSHSKIG